MTRVGMNTQGESQPKSAHENGLTHAGKSDSGTRKPQTSQTGYSSIVPSAHDWRKRTNATAKTKPSAPIETTMAGTASANANGSWTTKAMPKTKRPQRSVAVML